MVKDTVGFPEDLGGFKFNPKTGEALYGIGRYVDEELTVDFYESGWFYHIDNWIIGPGVRQKAGIISFATKESADKLVEWIKEKVSKNLKISVEPTVWDVFKVVDNSDKEVPQYQLNIKDSDGKPLNRINAGLTISTIIRAQNTAFAAEIVKNFIY